jgi:hypothetical protein
MAGVLLLVRKQTFLYPSAARQGSTAYAAFYILVLVAIRPAVKGPASEADHSSPSTAEVKNIVATQLGYLEVKVQEKLRSGCPGPFVKVEGCFD